tara:strand:- start:212 stop:2749 length:2538 start_codon:yes stop_codon:yes gene_type:complete
MSQSDFVSLSEQDENLGDTSLSERFFRKLIEVRVLKFLSVFPVVLSCFFVLWVVNPDGVLFTRSTPTGGDLGAHIWGPAFLRDELIPNFRLSGWSPDWYAGFPAYHFYMVVPMLFIVVLNAGLVLPLVVLVVVGSALLLFKLWNRKPKDWRPLSLLVACFLLLVIPIHYGLAFKFVTVIGLFLMPLAAWKMGRLAGLASTPSALLGASTLAFIFDQSFNIMGGNLMSTMAGEFAFTLALVCCLLYMGFLIKGVETGSDRSKAALFLALTGLCHLLVAFFAVLVSLVAVATRPSKASFRWLTTVALLSGSVSAFWVLPFWWQRAHLNDMGWEKLTSYSSYLWSRDELAADFLKNEPPLQLVVVAAILGALLSLIFRRRLGTVLAISAVLTALVFVYLPEGRLYNGRLLPFYYLSVYLLAALAVAELFRLLGGLIHRKTEKEETFGNLVEAGFGLLAVVSLIFYLATPLRVLPGGSMEGNTYRWMGIETENLNIGRSWVSWNFSGYEERVGDVNGGGWEELVDFVLTMDDLGKEYGCGRLMWEYSPELVRYGTPMAPMLMPHWTDGCIGSMEGLYFESSTTTPFHFLIQSELSKEPSRAQRNLPFRSFDIDSGVDHLQQFGVPYYASSSELATNEALKHPSLIELATSGPWTIFRVKNSDLVVPLDLEPVIMNKLKHSEWLVPAVDVFQKGSSEVTRTIGGMDTWQQLDQNQFPELRSLPEVSIGLIRNGTDYVHFEVDQVGIPVLVKTSYFPNWKVKGAEGPWRATPNFMVVVPTEEEVELSYGRTEIEVIAMVITFFGFAFLIFVSRRPNEEDFSTAWFDSNLIWEKIKKTSQASSVDKDSEKEV